MLLQRIDRALQVPSSKTTEATYWINDDIRPLSPQRRRWDSWTFISFWATNQICITNWQTASALIAVGLSVWQAMVATLLGKIFIALLAIFNGYMGAEWHIGFPVYSRVIWGIFGSYLSLLQRVLLCLVWTSVQSWTGGLCIEGILSAIFPSFHRMGNVFPESSHLTTQGFIGWILFNVISIPMVYVPPEKSKRLFIVLNTISFLTMFSIMVWATNYVHGGGPLLSAPATANSSSQLGWAIVKGVTTVLGSMAVGLTNVSDYSRFARKPGDQVFGQCFSITIIGTILPLFGCLTSSATQQIYGETIWNPPNIVLKWLDTDYNAKSRAAAFFAGVGLCASQLAINTIDNHFSTGMDLSGVMPRYINIRRGGYIGLVISIAMCPWELLSAASVFISVMSAYAVFLGPLMGIQVCDYWIVRKRKLKLSDMYTTNKAGVYYYWNGVNWRTALAWVVGWAPQLPGFINAINPKIAVPDGCVKLYWLAFPVGFMISFLLHIALNHFWPPNGLGEIDPTDVFGTFTPAEAAKLGVEPVPATEESFVLEGCQIEEELKGVMVQEEPKTVSAMTSRSD